LNSCSYYDVFDETKVRVNDVIEKMNKQHTHFLSEMRECGLLYETDPSLPFPRLDASLYDDCESSLPLESNFVADAPLIDLEEVFHSPLTSLSFAAPFFSSTAINTSVSDLSYLPLPSL